MTFARRFDTRATAHGQARGERGQMLIVFALIVVPVSFLLAAVAVDTSAWQSERRGAQKDADMAALAGALELVKPDPGDANAAARSSLAANDEAGNGGAQPANVRNVTVDNSCFPLDPRNDAVTVDVDHTSQTFFSSIFGLKVAPEIGAHAKACAGATEAPDSIVPIETDLTTVPCFAPDGAPQFGAACPIEYGAKDGNPRGILDLQASGDYCSEASGSGDVGNLIEFGAKGTCLINTTGACDPTKNGPWYDCVAVQEGNPTTVGRAFERRIAREGACDTDGDGIEEFDEVVTLAFDSPDPSKRIYEPRDCDPSTEALDLSPRLITIIVLKEPPDLSASNAGYPIYAFAGFYVEGCNSDPTSDAELDPKCNFPGGGGGSRGGGGGGGSCGSGGGGGCGQVVVWGRLVNLIVAGHEAGPPNETTTLFSISLKE